MNRFPCQLTERMSPRSLDVEQVETVRYVSTCSHQVGLYFHFYGPDQNLLVRTQLQSRH